MKMHENPTRLERDADLEFFINSQGGITLRQEHPLGSDDFVILEPRQVPRVAKWLQDYLAEFDAENNR